MKILLQGSLGLYGVQTFATRLAFNLTNMGFEVELVAPPGRSFVTRSATRGLNQPLRSRGWWKSYRNANLVHINYALVSLPLLAHPSTWRVPMVYTIHGVPLPEIESEPLYKIGYVLEKLTLRKIAHRAAKVIAISGYVRDLLKTIYGIDADIIHNGVDSELFYPPSPSLKRSLRSSLEVPPGRQLVLFVGRLHRYKDPLTLVRCIPSVLARNPSAYFVMIGDGPLKAAVQREATHLRIGGSLRLISHLPRATLIGWFQASDIFVSASPWEMLGIAVLEAMSAGIPIVAPASGGPLEVLGGSGTFFDPGDERDLAEKICLLLSDPESMIDKGHSAREIVLHNFRWDLVASRYAAVYKDAVSRFETYERSV
jgi:alpha-maltose-1-phosphate synthase